MFNINYQQLAHQQYNKYKTTPGTVNQMVADYQLHPTQKDKEIIFANIFKLVIRLVKKVLFSYNSPHFNDLIGEATVSFEKAINTYDITTGFNFNSYCIIIMSRDLYLYKAQYIDVQGITMPKTVILSKTKERDLSYNDKHMRSVRAFNIDNYNADNDNKKFDLEQPIDTECTATTLTKTDMTFADFWFDNLKPQLIKFLNSKRANGKFYGLERNFLTFEIYYGIGQDGDRLNFQEIGDLLEISRTMVMNIKINMINVIREYIINKPHLQSILKEFLQD